MLFQLDQGKISSLSLGHIEGFHFFHLKSFSVNPMK